MASNDPPAPSGGQPSHPTCVGVDQVLEQILTEEPRRVLVYEPNDLVPKRLTPRETREMLKGMRESDQPVIVTSRVQGSDMIVRTLEYLGDRNRPSVPTPPVPPDSDSRF